MVGIENSFTMGRKHVENILEKISSKDNPFAQNELYLPHKNKMPYEVEDNKICPFCTRIIKSEIKNKGRGYPKNDQEKNISLGKYNLDVITKVSSDIIEHFIKIN